MQMDHDAVVLVADGRKLLFFRNKGDATYPNLEAEAVKQQDNPAHLDQASDKAGQSSSTGTASGTVSSTGPNGNSGSVSGTAGNGSATVTTGQGKSKTWRRP